MYNYYIHVISVYDGDTITAQVDLGFNHSQKMKIRFFGIDTPELRGSEKEHGKLVRDYVKSLILNKTVRMESIKDKTGKYGRYLAKIYYNTEDGVEIYLNQHLLDKGYATELNY